ncbi:SusD family protein [Parapedobacter composti]|uniref:SusD family protein n=1 Tax=Parapedobacter composti TaxID=623281 RepID=A0A1I1K217_9SPHI|nr:RagB/SusD family nutrient uptake outer membrane protein [Parapedobacter composti]SFC54884.1 SusD family protein [Parapedobacter composti]
MKRLFIYGTMLVLSTACSTSFLELENPQGLDLRRTIVDVPSLKAATNGVYDKFQSIHYYNRSFLLYPEIIGDNMFVSRRNSGRYINYDFFRMNAEDGNATDTWYQMWRLIVNANLAIDRGEALELNTTLQAQANELIGEMYAARALCYFDMVRLYGQPYNYSPDASHLGVPLLIEPSMELVKPARASVKAVYDQIVADFERALSLVNSTQNNGRLTVPAIQALLAKVHLYREDWEQAERYATDVIDGNSHSLLGNAEYVASWAENFSSESIFEIVNSAIDRPGTDGIGYFVEPEGYGDGLASADLYNTYADTDVRKQLIEVGSRPSAETPAYIIRKYPRGATSMDDHIKVIRLSEVYLIRAEARAEIGKTNATFYAGAQADLNTIVQRADPEANDITLTGDALVQRIILERRKELAFEGNRLFDTNRKKMGIQHIQSDRTQSLSYPNNGFVLPISRTELQANPNMEPNPGYSRN